MDPNYNPYDEKKNDDDEANNDFLNPQNNDNPFNQKNNNQDDNGFNPYEDNNPFSENNKNNPFENNFDNDQLPSYPEEFNNNNNMNNMNQNKNNDNFNYYHNNNNEGFTNNFPNQNKINEINNNNNNEDEKKIKTIISKCNLLYTQAGNQFDNYKMKEALTTLCKSIRILDNLKQTINNKKNSFTPLIPQITSIRNKSFSTLQDYRQAMYQIIPLKFKFQKFMEKEPLSEFVKIYMLTEPFITFDDIFDSAMDNNKKLKFILPEYFKKSQRMGYKSLLIYGPKGSGKTLAVHALANSFKGKICQIQSQELFKIPYFSKELLKVAFNYMQFKPTIIYIENMEEYFSNMSNFNFIYDKTTSTHLENYIFIASTSLPLRKIPKEILNMFHYTYCIRSADSSQKYNYIKFISQKIGIKINMTEKELNSFAFQNLKNCSNEDIFNWIVEIINMKKKKYGDNNENQVYKEGLDINDLMNCPVKGNLTPEDIKDYYL